MRLRPRTRLGSPRRPALRRAQVLLGTWILASCGAGEDGDAAASAADADSGATADADGGSSGGATFLALPDAGVTGSCRPAIPGDCPEGEKCTAVVVQPGACCVDANRCVPVTGDRRQGETCEREAGGDDCADGLFCMTGTSGGIGPGRCVTMCEVGNDQSCADAGIDDASCFSFNSGVLPLCQRRCDPLLAGDCPGNDGCFGVGEQGFACTQPDFGTGGQDGGACTTVQSCQPGLYCTEGEQLEGCTAARCCTPLCDLREAGACAAPETCIPYFAGTPEVPEWTNVGFCGLPA